MTATLELLMEPNRFQNPLPKWSPYVFAAAIDNKMPSPPRRLLPTNYPRNMATAP